ncbi:MAG TPA: acyl carrier protein [Candidatus Baltobacteraceae bacterium]|nr:acyl carrier protein [Candidatus Baltobacteraceae bacterium]
MSDREESFSGVREAIVRTFALRSGDSIAAGTTSADVPGWDSLSHSLLLMAIEERFGIDLPLDRVYEARNVGDLVDLVEAARSHV